MRYTEMLKLLVHSLKKRKTEHNNPKEILQYAEPCLVKKIDTTFWMNKKQHLAMAKEVNIIFLQTINNLLRVFFLYLLVH